MTRPRPATPDHHDPDDASTDEPRRRGLPRGAVALARTVGLEGITIGNLAKVVEMTKSGVYAHFDSKEALQIAVLEAARP